MQVLGERSIAGAKRDAVEQRVGVTENQVLGPAVLKTDIELGGAECVLVLAAGVLQPRAERLLQCCARLAERDRADSLSGRTATAADAGCWRVRL